MDCSIDNTLDYIILLVRQISPEDLPHAIGMVLTELNFEVHLDGFEYLKDAIYLKSQCTQLRLSGIFQQIIQDYDGQVDSRQLEQSIRHSIKKAWAIRNEETWYIMLPQHQWKTRYPSSNVFISRIAFLMDLWSHCEKKSSTEIS